MEREKIILFVIIFLLLISSILVYLNKDDISIEKKDCYDNNNNKIVGIICEKEIYNFWYNLGITSLFYSGLFLLLYLIVVYGIGGGKLW